MWSGCENIFGEPAIDAGEMSPTSHSQHKSMETVITGKLPKT